MLTALRTPRWYGASRIGMIVGASAEVIGRIASTMPPTVFCHAFLPLCTLSAAFSISSARAPGRPEVADDEQARAAPSATGRRRACFASILAVLGEDLASDGRREARLSKRIGAQRSSTEVVARRSKRELKSRAFPFWTCRRAAGEFVRQFLLAALVEACVSRASTNRALHARRRH